MQWWNRDVTQFLVRLVVGGALVAMVPWVAQRFSPRIAGVVVLFPAVTVVGLTFLWLDRGHSAVEEAAAAGVWAVPAVALYLLVLWLLLRSGVPYVGALAAAVLAWVAFAGIVLVVRGRA
jgi:uncharacterized membrane protein (GlpM family)